MCGRVAIAVVSTICFQVVRSCIEKREETEDGGRTLRCSVKPSVPPMATSPSSSRPRFLERGPHCCWANMIVGVVYLVLWLRKAQMAGAALERAGKGGCSASRVAAVRGAVRSRSKGGGKGRRARLLIK